MIKYLDICYRASTKRVNVTVSRLYVRKIQDSDKGSYTCAATIDSVTIRLSVQLIIYGN